MSLDERYPIGKYEFPEEISSQQIDIWIQEIKDLPKQIRQALDGLTEQQLDLPYREGGWTIRQVVHHLADSHINSYTRFRLALTEDKPTIKTYDEQLWAELPDAKWAPVEVSLQLLESVHKRWGMLLDSLSSQDFKRCFLHPELGEVSLDVNIGLYAWHGKHHMAHIMGLRKKMNI